MITNKMVNEHLQKALHEGGVLASSLSVVEMESKTTNFSGLSELNYEKPENKAFYSAAYVLMDSQAQEIVTHNKRRIGGFNLYPINYSSERVGIKPRVFSGQYRMGFSNFELAASMLPKEALEKLNAVYKFIREDIESEVEFNTEDSTMVLHRTSWEPPHFHVQDKADSDHIYSVSYAVKIAGTGEHTSIFDFFSDKFQVIKNDSNTITKIYFQSKFIHQVFKTSLSDQNMYFFFVWDGCRFNHKLNLQDHVYVQRYYNPDL